jgi:hypothetical protein
MRKIILGIATISLTFSVASAVAATQPKAGSTCTKLNQVSGTGAAKILCTKVANRLVWSKAPAVAPIQPIASTPTPTPSPTATKNQAEVNVDLLRIKAYKELHKVTCSSSHPNIVVTKTVGAGVTSEAAGIFDKLSESAFNCFNSYFPKSINLQLFYITEKDLDVVNSGIAPLLLPADLDHLKSTLNDSVNHVWGSIGSVGGIAKYNSATNTAYFVLHLSSYHQIVPSEYKTVMHEFTHILQSYGRKDAKLNSEQSFFDNFPGYFSEGGAETLGYAFAATSEKEFNDFVIEGEKHSNHSLADAFNLKYPADVITQLKTVSFPKSRFEKDFQYNFGELFCEYILGTYGLDKFLELMKNGSQFPLWADNVQATLGLSLDKLYSDAAPWMLPLWNAGA